MIRMTADISEWMKLIDDLIHIKPSTLHELDLALALVFEDTQGKVHVQSGALLSSGRTDTDFDGTTWIGSVVYGPPGVSYAEMERKRGGEHDFLRDTELYNEVFLSAMESAWS
jgi:hypothetical protein